MMRLMVYSHDTFGLGNIRRMLAICEYLLEEIPELSILLLSGSPMLQGFRLPERLDYIKLPCLNRGETGQVAVKYLGMNLKDTIKLRSQVILSAAINFQPNMFLVDKKAYGIENELVPTVRYLHKSLPETKMVLLFRDILDHPDKIINEWKKQGYYAAIEKYYESLLVVGTPDVLDFCEEYQLPQRLREKVKFCGYLRRPSGYKTKAVIRQELKLRENERLVLVTPGGGQDGYKLIDNYLQGIEKVSNGVRKTCQSEYQSKYQSQSLFKSLIICGPEMPKKQINAIYQSTKNNPQVILGEFTDDMMSYLEASDAVVSMAGYNTICEILSAAKPAVIVPRIQPSQEQFIRSQRMGKKASFLSINPDSLNPDILIDNLFNLLENSYHKHQIDLQGLPRIANYIQGCFKRKSSVSCLETAQVNNQKINTKKLTYSYSRHDGEENNPVSPIAK